jgi:hypothetical protein
MQQELLNQVKNLFDTFEKWNAFLELSAQMGEIKTNFFTKVRDPLYKYFIENPVEGWVCESWGNPDFDLRWYLTDFGKNSLGIGIAWTFDFVLTLEDAEKFDSVKIEQLLKTPEYSKILTAFERIDYQFTEVRRKIIETGNYQFGSPYDYNFKDPNKTILSWYAGNRTNEFVDQIIKKVERFRKDTEVTRLLRQLNELSKK